MNGLINYWINYEIKYQLTEYHWLIADLDSKWNMKEGIADLIPN